MCRRGGYLRAASSTSAGRHASARLARLVDRLRVVAAGGDEEALISVLGGMVRSLALALLFVPPIIAQTTIDAGVALGRQSYESRADDPKDLRSIEALGLRQSAGIHIALDFADLSQEGRVT